MKHECLLPIGREEAQCELDSGDFKRMSAALVRLALHDPDRTYVERVLGLHLQSSDAWVRGVAATCVGHIARIHGAIDAERLMPLLKNLAKDPRTRGRMEDALEDIAMFAEESRA